MPSPQPPYGCGSPSTTLLQWLEVTSFEICWFPQQVSSGKPHCHPRSLFLDPLPQFNPSPPTKKYWVSKKYGEYSSLPHMEDLKDTVPPGRLGCAPRAIGSVFDPIPNLIGSSVTPFKYLSGSFPSSPSFHHCRSCSFQPLWSLCSADGRIPSVKWEGRQFEQLEVHLCYHLTGACCSSLLTKQIHFTEYLTACVM